MKDCYEFSEMQPGRHVEFTYTSWMGREKNYKGIIVSRGRRTMMVVVGEGFSIFKTYKERRFRLSRVRMRDASLIQGYPPLDVSQICTSPDSPYTDEHGIER